MSGEGKKANINKQEGKNLFTNYKRRHRGHYSGTEGLTVVIDGGVGWEERVTGQLLYCTSGNCPKPGEELFIYQDKELQTIRFPD